MPFSGSWRKPQYWPTPQDYNEAVQNLHATARDPEIRAAVVETGRFGLPKPITGGFASVYKFHGKDRKLAVRCFLRNVPDLENRYQAVSEFLKQANLPYTTDFDYQREGINIHGRLYPILKMEWVEGITLDDYVRTAILMHKKLDEAIPENFKKMCLDLGASGMAHGDLQHGNLLVSGQSFMLVDYDGIYVPSLAGCPGTELGHRNYQHPKRSPSHWGANVDNFSSWAIYISLKALSADPLLLKLLDGGDDCLLFRQKDFLEPTTSRVFCELEHHDNRELRQLSRYLRWLLLSPADEVPPLSEAPTIPLRLLPVQPQLPKAVQNNPLGEAKQQAMADWLQPTNIVQLSANERQHESTRGELRPNRSKVTNHPKLAQIELLLLQKAHTGLLPRELRFVQPRILSDCPRLKIAKLALFAAATVACASSLILLYAHFGPVLWVMATALSVTMVLFMSDQVPIACHDERVLLTTGEAVPGIIVEKFRRHKIKYVEFVYLHDGQPRAAHMEVSTGDFQRTQVGNMVTVLYNRDSATAIIYDYCAYRSAF